MTNTVLCASSLHCKSVINGLINLTNFQIVGGLGVVVDTLGGFPLISSGT